MKRRIVKKVERYVLVDKVCELQREIDEYDRFLGDLMLMLLKRNPDWCSLEHGFTKNNDYASIIWRESKKLIEECRKEGLMHSV